MKLEKNKHNHKLTDLLKVGIFALLMIAPLLASVSQMIYATCNKNAKDSWSGTTWTETQTIYYESNEVNTVDDLHVGNIYKYQFDNTYSGSSQIVKCETIPFIYYTARELRNNTEYATPPYFYLFRDNNVTTLIVNQYLDGVNQNFNYSNNDTYLYFVLGNNTIGVLNAILPYCTQTNYKVIKGYQQVEQQETLDNAFYYGVNRMTEEELFNWTENTLLYTGIKGMTDNLGVQTNAIAILITYWTILTIIYVILDIVIKEFTFITHLIVRSE